MFRKRPAVKRRRVARTRRIAIAPFPGTKIVKMRYCDSVSIPPGTAGLMGKYVFRLNSIYDPDVTATGHQPLGHDQMAVLFRRYAVLGAKVKIEWVSDQDSGVTMNWGARVQDTSSFAFDVTTVRENQLGQNRLVIAGQQPNWQRNMVMHYSTKKFFNVKDVRDNDNLSSLFGTSPISDVYLVIWRQAFNLTAALPYIYFNVTIDYIVDLSEPNTIGTS